MKHLSPKMTSGHSPVHSSNSPSPSWYVDESQRWLICQDELREFFDLPEGAEVIQFEAHDKRFPGSLKVELGQSLVIEGDAGDRCTCLFHATDIAIDTLVGDRRVWYVKLYYWE